MRGGWLLGLWRCGLWLCGWGRGRFRGAAGGIGWCCAAGRLPDPGLCAALISGPAAGKTLDKTATGLTYIPAPKLKLPGHEESYNPPKEYLPTEVRRLGGGWCFPPSCRAPCCCQ